MIIGSIKCHLINCRVGQKRHTVFIPINFVFGATTVKKCEIIDDHFLQRVSIACYAKRYISHRKSVCLTVRLTVCHTLV